MCPPARPHPQPLTPEEIPPSSSPSESEGPTDNPADRLGEPEPNGLAATAVAAGGSLWGTLAMALLLALGLRQFVVEARFIPSGSMLPGLQIDDKLLVEKLTYRLREPRRGEIVVFHAPHHFDPALRGSNPPGPLRCLMANLPGISNFAGIHEPACDAYIKRVVAVPGDRVLVDPRGRVQVNGQILQEPYVTSYCPVDSQGVGPCRPLAAVVPAGHVLVLGDNRANSWDGRFWPGGPFLPESEIIGRAVWRFYPLSTFGGLGAADPLPQSSPNLTPSAQALP
jgi:signal peptidase I